MKTGTIKHKCLKVIESWAPMPSKKFFELDEQVLVEFKTGNYSIGQIKQVDARCPNVVVIYRQGRHFKVQELT